MLDALDLDLPERVDLNVDVLPGRNARTGVADARFAA
jgi:hypothetical protein